LQLLHTCLALHGLPINSMRMVQTSDGRHELGRSVRIDSIAADSVVGLPPKIMTRSPRHDLWRFGRQTLDIVGIGIPHRLRIKER
jgi:hypothetical protein